MGPGSIPGQGTKIPQALWCSQKQQQKEKNKEERERESPPPNIYPHETTRSTWNDQVAVDHSAPWQTKKRYERSSLAPHIPISCMPLQRIHRHYRYTPPLVHPQIPELAAPVHRISGSDSSSSYLLTLQTCLLCLIPLLLPILCGLWWVHRPSQLHGGWSLEQSTEQCSTQ